VNKVHSVTTEQVQGGTAVRPLFLYSVATHSRETRAFFVSKSITRRNMNQSQTTHRVLSGIRATGRLHLGNYLGAVKGMLELQEDSEYQTLYMVADAHAVTTPYNIEELRI